MKRTGSDDAYRADLAYIHDAGFGRFAEAAAGALLQQLPKRGLHAGLVVDLGCGSGILSAAVAESGYDVLGVDISRAMVALSGRRVPGGTFRHGSVLDAEITPCVAVAAVGEIFNYLFDGRHSLARLKDLFRRVYSGLAPGGLFLFDVALVGRVPGGTQRNYTELDDWACLYEAQEDRTKKTLTRQITTFRKVGRMYRRDHEVHRLRLFERDEIAGPLRKLGFRVRTSRGYGAVDFPPGWVGFVARKP